MSKLFDLKQIKTSLSNAKGRALREVQKIDISDIKEKIIDTKDDVLNRIDEATSKFETEVNLYVKKSVKIAAAKYTYPLSDELRDWIGDSVGEETPNGMLEIITLEGSIFATHGDMIIQGIQGEFYPCKPDIFEASYKRA
jgi:hypothetical protein